VSAVACELCPRACVIPEGKAGDCRVRVNQGGRLVATTYGRPSAIHLDPVEKKPLFHFLPGSQILSVATAGCNLHCLGCQNWQLSQRGGEEMEALYRAPPERLVAAALREACPSIAYTYAEPLVFYEYTADCAAEARRQGLKNVLVTAAYINQAPLRALCKVIDAANADLKAFDDRFYQENCGARLAPVLDALVTMRAEGLWLELTNLIIPGLNDDLGLIGRMARWIRDELGAHTPLHLSRFRPEYRLRNLPPTPTATLSAARDVARDAGLDFVYVGNVHGSEGESTFCPHDGSLLVGRVGYNIEAIHIMDGRCPSCGASIPGVWQ